MSDIADALVHLHDRLNELASEVKPGDSPRVVIRWTVEDFNATQILVDAMWQNVSVDHERLLRQFMAKRAATSIGQDTGGSSTPEAEDRAGGDAPTASEVEPPKATNSAARAGKRTR